MKNFLLLCILVILGYTVAAQQPNSVDSLYANVIFPNTQVNDTKAAIKGNNTVITAKTGNVFDGIMLVNNVSYTAIKLAGDNPGTASECYSVKFSETSDSIFVVNGIFESIFGQGHKNARSRVLSTNNPDSSKFAISFSNPTNSTSNLYIKDSYLTDSTLYLLVDGVTANTAVEVVLNNGIPQAGTALAGTGAVFMKVDISTGAILKQTYFYHNDNDGFLDQSFFNKQSLLKFGNLFFFHSASSLDENCMLHMYDDDLNVVYDFPIVTNPYAPGDELNSYVENATSIGVDEYGDTLVGFIPKTIPVIVNITKGVVSYIEDGKALNDRKAPTVGAYFIDSSFIFIQGSAHGWIKRIEINTMTPSIIVREWITDSEFLNGKGSSSAQRAVQSDRIRYLTTLLRNGKIEYLAGTRINQAYPNGLFINGERVAYGNSFSIDDVVIFKGAIDLNITGPVGTETLFSSPDSKDSVKREGHKIIFTVDSADLGNVNVIRQTGPGNSIISCGPNTFEDFSNDSINVVFTLDLLNVGEVNTIRVYVESAVAKSSGIGIEEELESQLLLLYPNPFTDFLIIPDVYQNNTCQLVIYDSTGKIVFQGEKLDERVNVSHLTSGLYIVHILDGDSRITQKLLK